MQYLLTVCVASMLVAGQALWKYGIINLRIDEHAPLLKKVVASGLNVYILLGCVVYFLATILYIYVIGRYAYGASYAMIVSFSLILATGVAAWFFNEKVSLPNILGIIIILFGVFLVIKR